MRNAGNKAKLSPASAGTWAELGKINAEIVVLSIISVVDIMKYHRCI